MVDHKAYRLVSIFLLSLSTIFLAFIAFFLLYGGLKLKDESSVVTSQVSQFDHQVNNINTNLKSISKELSQQSSNLKVPTSLPPGL